jgi:hypothetical protein
MLLIGVPSVEDIHTASAKTITCTVELLTRGRTNALSCKSRRWFPCKMANTCDNGVSQMSTNWTLARRRADASWLSVLGLSIEGSTVG